MSVRPPGYYTSWYHFVADLPTGKDINLYDWIVANSYWNNTGKKLNAMITINSDTVISASDLSNKITSSSSTSNCKPAILIGNEFRYYDRISIWNNGKIIGAYGNRDFSGTGNFTPPTESSSNGIVITHGVTSATLTVAAGGGAGGKASAECPGASGGGGGSGGKKVSSVSVTPGSLLVAVGGDAGENASYNVGSPTGPKKLEATKGKDGTDGECGNRFKTCLGVEIFGACLNWGNGWDKGESGKGGDGGLDNGQKGGDGSAAGKKLDRDNCECKRGGSPGAGPDAGGAGGKGGDFCCKDGTGPGKGSKGWHNYSYTRRELFGPAINVKHTNVRLYNSGGIIAGGYSSQNMPTIYALYGSKNIENSDIGGIIVPSSPGFTSNPF